MRVELVAYVHVNGRCFVEGFLDGLSARDRAIVDRALERLRQYGDELRRPYAAPLEHEIFELRIRVPNRELRLLYFFVSRNHVVVVTQGLFHKGNVKLGDKIDPVEINRAVSYRGFYLTGAARGKPL